MKPSTILLITAVLSLTAACSGPGGVQVSGAWARTAPAGENSGAYMLIANGGPADRLVSAASEAASAVEIHETKSEGGMMNMSPVEGVDLPANGQVEFKPGGLHVMLIGLRQELKAGDSITLVLTLEQAGEISVTAEVREP